MMQSLIVLENTPVYRLRCLAWHEDYLAYLVQTESGQKVALTRIDPVSLHPASTKYFSGGQEFALEIKFISYRKQYYVAAVFETYAKFFSLDGTMVGFYQEEAAIAESNEDWLTAVATFLEDGDKERVVLATRGGRLLASIANTFEFEVRHASKRNICSMCVVGQSIIVGEENGRLLRLSSFEDGFTKELNLSQQKLPIEILQKHNDTQVLVGTCQGEVLLVDIVNLTVILRIYAHAALINCICRLNDFIITSSEDGYINKFRIVEGGLAVFSPSKVARLVQGIVVVASRVFLVCYELATLKQLQ